MTTLRISGLCAGYGGTQVINDLDLVVAAGDLTAVLGPSGCGKTTLLRMIAGFHPATAGAIYLGDRMVNGASGQVKPELRRVGIVPQDGALFPHLSVAGNVGFGLSRIADRGAQIDQMLSLVGLAGFGDRMPHELSGGQQQRVAVARALAPQPDVVLLDEPFASLDATLRAEVRAQVVAALHAAEVTGVLVTHDQQEALSVADTVAVMRQGHIVQHNTPSRVYHEPVSTWVARFVGEAIVLPAVRVGRGRAQCSLGEIPVIDVSPSDSRERCDVVLRPEQLRLSDDATGVTALVEGIEYFGHDALVSLAVGDTSIQARVSAKDIPDIGSKVSLAVERPALVFATGSEVRRSGQVL